MREWVSKMFGIFYDWYKYGNYREMSRAEAFLILFGSRKRNEGKKNE